MGNFILNCMDKGLELLHSAGPWITIAIVALTVLYAFLGDGNSSSSSFNGLGGRFGG
jgi:hypothetical protein